MSTAESTTATDRRQAWPARILHNAGMSRKILALVGVAAVLCVGIGAIGTRAVLTVRGASDEMVSVTAERMRIALHVEAEFNALRRDILFSALVDGEAGTSAHAAVEESFATVHDLLDELAATGMNAEESALIEAEQARLAAVQTQYTEQIAPLADRDGLTGDQYRELGELIRGDFAEAADDLRDSFEEMADLAVADLAAEAEAAADEADAALVEAWVIMAAGIAALVGFGWWLARVIVATVTRVRDGLVALADGDLRQQVPVSGADEIGQMAQALNRTGAALRSAMEDISSSSGTLSSSAEELSVVSTQVEQNSAQTSAQAQSLAATSAQVSGNVHTVAAGTEEMTTSIQEIARSSSEAARVASGAATEAASATTTVGKLGTSSAEIGNVIKVITSIAEQTNLLALNATIEAARAGDAGKGFAVVAEEVKQLARETAQATEDIAGRVGAIQSDAREAVEAIERISRTIEDVNAFQTTIATAVEEQTSVTGEIARSIDETARAAERISTDVAAVSSAAESSSTGIGEARRAAEDLARVAGGLNQLVGRFRI